MKHTKLILNCKPTILTPNPRGILTMVRHAPSSKFCWKPMQCGISPDTPRTKQLEHKSWNLLNVPALCLECHCDKAYGWWSQKGQNEQQFFSGWRMWKWIFFKMLGLTIANSCTILSPSNSRMLKISCYNFWLWIKGNIILHPTMSLAKKKQTTTKPQC